MTPLAYVSVSTIIDPGVYNARPVLDNVNVLPTLAKPAANNVDDTFST